jgi:hypothetical protein
MTLWWEWKDQPVKPGRYLCCWGHTDDYRNNIYEVHHFDGARWFFPHARPEPLFYAEITHPQEETLLRELNQM